MKTTLAIRIPAVLFPPGCNLAVIPNPGGVLFAGCNLAVIPNLVGVLSDGVRNLWV